MLAWLTANPTLARLFVWLLSVLIAWCINWGIITQAYRPRAIGPWSPLPKGARTRSWLDWMPMIGWWRLAREREFHADRFWLRPFLIEVIFPLAMVWLYDANVTGKLLPTARLAAALQAELHCQFLAQLLLLSLMTVATFIDFDEHLIPDTVTQPGTLLGLVGSAGLAAWFPWLPFVNGVEEMHAASIGAWPGWMSGPRGLLIAWLVISVYCFGLLDRVWITRRGWAKAFQYFLAVMFRSRWWMIVLAIWFLLMAGTTSAYLAAIPRWQYLLSAYLGMAGAGGYTWLIRIAARRGLGVEALGFGDVTLMAMIGVYLGWQASILVFFVSPFFAVLVFAIRRLLFGVSAGAYGPFLCMGAAVVLINWEWFRKTYAAPILELPGWMTWSILCGALLIMWAALAVYVTFFGRVRGIRQVDDA